MKRRSTRRNETSPEGAKRSEEVLSAMREVFTPAAVDALRDATDYNPRQRVATAHRILLVVLEGFLLGQTLTFAALRALFVRRFGAIRSCPFQKRFKQASAVAFFRDALRLLVDSVVCAAGLDLGGALGRFTDILVYDGTGQRVPPRGRPVLPGCTPGKAGTKWVVGYRVKTGLLDDAECGAETAAEIPLRESLVSQWVRGALYLFDLGYFGARIFEEARLAGADVLMRLKKGTKIQIVGQFDGSRVHNIPSWSLSYFLGSVPSRRRGTLFDLDVSWGKAPRALALRLVGIAHTSTTIRWYLTTVPRSKLSAAQVIQAYRLRWLIELLFRELKQNADLGRSFTADVHAVQALTYGAMIAHVLVRSLRIQAALKNEIPLEQLRPLACLHVARAYASDIVDALSRLRSDAWNALVGSIGPVLVALAHELKPSRSRRRIAWKLGAIGA